MIFDEYNAERRDWCEYWTVEKYLKEKIPFKKCLSICCGFGHVERVLSKLNVAEEIIGTDIAPGAIQNAERRAANEKLDNISYYLSDLNTDELPQNEYDIIWANGALHHIKNLDSIIPKLVSSLKKGGYLIANEYVGPNYQQLDLRHQEIVNAVKHILPPELRNNKVYKSGFIRNILSKHKYGKSTIARIIRKLLQLDEKISFKNGDNNKYSQIWQMNPVEYFLHTDPSECVNSSEIIPTLTKCFEDVEIKYFNGSILSHILGSKFYNNFNVNNQKHKKLLETLFLLEDYFVEIKEIPNENAHIICRKS